ncbi:hypothetical protein [Pseudomonas sp. SWI44]|uniref:hypothetical protein n=1 Tax=Pseudomonas sp. SWI44 TaxID=2083053 RepID=UPI000CE5F2DB|nr:hypothetical protein [Pseudomonas sp. SWI44]AVD88487.1 hypothetical protein C4Q26_15615 [Pseudomonas sp. SWI44]
MKIKCGIALIALIQCTNSMAVADLNPQLDRAMKLSIETSNAICGQAPLAGETTKTTVQGNIDAQLSGLAKKLAKLGISLSADHTKEAHQGVLKSQVLDAIKSTQTCKLEVLKTITAHLSSMQDKEEATHSQTITNSKNANNFNNVSNSPINIRMK